MKNRKHEKSVVAKIVGWWIRNMVARAKALNYGRAALCDERNGFPYTAAMEWRQAAELLGSGSVAAESCWWQWERIVHLPRQLAGSYSSSRRVTFPLFYEILGSENSLAVLIRTAFIYREIQKEYL